MTWNRSDPIRPEDRPLSEESATETPGPAPPEPAGFGLSTATYIVVSCMVGVGILTTSGYTVNSVQSNALMIALWGIGGAIALCGALSEAELASALPRSGGDYVFIREAYGPFMGFLTGWVTLVFGFGGPIAAAALTSASYWIAAFGDPGASPPGHLTQAIATGLILALAAAHMTGARQTVRLQGTTTLAVVVGLSLFVIAGLIAGRGNFANVADWPEDSGRGRLNGAIISLIFINYGYIGWNSAAYIAGEVRDPRKTIPRALILGTGAVTLLYLAINLVYALALPASTIVEMAGRKENIQPIAELAARSLFGPSVAAPLSMFIGILLASMVSAFIVAGPRVLREMAREGHFPRFAARTSERLGTPAIATGIVAAFAIALAWTPNFEDLLKYTSIGLATFSMITVSAVFKLRIARPDLPRPYRVPGYPLTPLIFIAASATLIAVAAIDSPRVAAISVASMLAGAPLYPLVLMNRKGKGPEADTPPSPGISG